MHNKDVNQQGNKQIAQMYSSYHNYKEARCACSSDPLFGKAMLRAHECAWPFPVL